jgi:hypothetical protein
MTILAGVGVHVGGPTARICDWAHGLTKRPRSASVLERPSTSSVTARRCPQSCRQRLETYGNGGGDVEPWVAYDLIMKDRGPPAEAESASGLVAKDQRAYRELSVQGDVHMKLARLHGTLRRASEQDDCDFLVEGSHGHFIRVRLVPEHLVGPPGGPVVLDSCGKPFADDGDEVLCVGGGIPASNVEGGRSVFVAGKLRVFE